MIKHIDFAIVPKTHPSMYLMHKYWARKPHNVVAEYIKHYSKEGDVVLDPFVGSGVTVIEAIKLGRKAIGIDLDPMALFITKCTGMLIDMMKLKEEFRKIEAKVKEKVHSLYRTICPTCKKERVTTHVVWVKKNNTVEEPIEIWYVCTKCQRKGSKFLKKVPDKDDIALLKKIESKKISFWYPKNELIWNSRINVWKGECVSDLFTKRSLFALAIILNEMKKAKDSNIEDILKFAFTSSLVQTSRMIPYQGGFKTGGASWKIRGYWVPTKHFEINVWNCFENRFKKIIRGKDESNKCIGNKWEEGKRFEDLKKKKVLLYLQSALNLKKIPSNSIDYVFTDPPYGDSVPYLELHYMWSSWLKFKPNFDEEIIISDSPVRDRKSEELYTRMISKSFKEVFRVLKQKHYLTVTFHNADIGIYNSVLRSIILAGFELEKILYQPPATSSTKAKLAPYGSAEGDYYIRFKKPEISKKIVTEKDVDLLRFERIVVEAIKKIIAERAEPVTYNEILKNIYIELDKAGYLTIAKTKNIKKILEKLKDKEFTFIKGEGWWFKDPEKYFLHITPLQDRVEKFVIQVLRKKVIVSFDEVLQELFLKLKNALTPEPTKVKVLLEEYAMKIKGGKWELKPIVELRAREHSKLIGMLAKIGGKFGFKVHIGKKEQSDIYEGKPLHQFIDKELPTLSEEEKGIDIVWIKNGKINYAFEVEFTTYITEAIMRGSYIKPDKVTRVFLIPEERENLLYKKVNAPILKDRISKQNWKFIFFKDLKEFVVWSKRRKRLRIPNFEKLFKELKEDRIKQATLEVIKE